MIFNYKVFDEHSNPKDGTIDAVNQDAAVVALQRMGYVIVTIKEVNSQNNFIAKLGLFNRVSNKEVVIMSRQISTLFEAEVSVLKAFQLLAGNSDSAQLKRALTGVADDIQGGESIAAALSKHPEVFSPFYVNMVRSGEESGKLSESFSYLADYLDRQYELTTKTRNALIYPAFVIGTFFVVMILMMTLVVPRLSKILVESGQEIPLYTKVVIGISNFLVTFGPYLLVVIAAALFYVWRFVIVPSDGRYFDELKLSIPYVSDLYRKLYLSRIADNLNTMLSSGISIVRALEVTATIVDNKIYEDILKTTATDVKGGKLISDAFYLHPEIPNIMIQMIRIGEETGKLGYVLANLAKFYKREVDNAVDTLVGLIEPIMIVGLGLGVGLLLTSILMPIYNIAGNI